MSKRLIPKYKFPELISKIQEKLLNLRNKFISENNHLNYIPDMNDKDSYNNAIVINKGRQHMYVYDKNGKLVFNSPVSTGANIGNKEKEGDSKTPVGKFAISTYEPNRDPKIFGAPQFWRLRGTNFQGIGIHGDARHPDKIGTPASHGCIRMPSDSIPSFQAKAKPYPGQTVYILDERGNY